MSGLRVGLWAALLGLMAGTGTAAAGVFADEAAARAFVQARLARNAQAPTVPGRPALADPYLRSYSRRHMTVAGKPQDLLLVAGAARELALARSFAALGFEREARCHYRNVLAFHARSAAALPARTELLALRAKGVVGRFAPGTPIYLTEDHTLVAPATRVALSPLEQADVAGDARAVIARIQHPALERCVPTGKLEGVAVIDGDGRLLVSEERPADARAEAGRVYYRIPDGARSLYDAQRAARQALLARAGRALGDPAALDAATRRQLAAAYRYVDLTPAGLTDALPRRADLTVDRLDALAGDPSSPLTLDAHYLRRVWLQPRLTLELKARATRAATLPVAVRSRSIETLTFDFHPIAADPPADERALEAWLVARREAVRGAPEYSLRLRLSGPDRGVRLPLKSPGSYVVVARGGGLTASFVACRVDATLSALAFPRETMLVTGRPGWRLTVGKHALAPTDPDGLASAPPYLTGYKCAAHVTCCASCDSCLHHHRDAAELQALTGTAVYAAGHRQFFRSQTKLDTRAFAKAKPQPARPLLLVHTDRPTYRAGDTLRFRGILRLPRTPLRRGDVSRTVPGADQPVEVKIARKTDTLFERKYVTGVRGTFSGQFTLPLSVARAEYTLTIEHAGVTHTQAFEVADYIKRETVVELTAEAGGVRVRGGYSWGQPVGGARLVCRVDGKAARLRGDRLKVKDGQTIDVTLVRDGTVLARKTMVYRAPTPATATADGPATEITKVPGKAPATATPKPAARPVRPARAPAFTIVATRPVVGRGEAIELQIRAPARWKDAAVTVVLGDQQLYDLRRVKLDKGRASVQIPARGVHDPGVIAFALCKGQLARTQVAVRTQVLPLTIEAPAQARPGSEVEIRLQTEPGAEIALAAVDEAVYMLRADDTPPLYRQFHPERKGAMAHGSFASVSYPGATRRVAAPLTDERIRGGEALGARLASGDEVSVAIFENDAIGMGGRAGGTFGARRGGGGSATSSAVLVSHIWLARTQRPDGSWAEDGAAVGSTRRTALALLAFLGAGQTHRYGRNKDNVKRALRWLMKRQRADGRVPDDEAAGLGHAIATLALCETYGMTKSPLVRGSATSALAALGRLQRPGGGWPRGAPRADLWTTLWSVMALRSAHGAELALPDGVALSALSYLRMQRPTRAGELAGTAVALIMLTSNRIDAQVGELMRRLMTIAPRIAPGDARAAYFGTLATYQMGGATWRAWRPHLDRLVRSTQRKDGSWPGGVEATTLSTLSLEIYYRYSRVFGGGGGDAPPTPLVRSTRMRTLFLDTVLWAPHLVADGQGRARIALRLPDQLTSTRLTARGIGANGAAGERVTRIRSHLPLFVRLERPAFLRVGDTAEIRALIHNETGQPLTGSVVLVGDRRRNVTLPPDRPTAVSWRISAREPGPLVVEVRVRAGRHSDAVRRTIPVRHPGRLVPVAQRISARAGAPLALSAPPGSESAIVTLHPRGAPLSRILAALRYLNSYPHG